jgi:hypothetical protein
MVMFFLLRLQKRVQLTDGMREKFADSFADSLASHLDLSLALVIDDFIDLKEPTVVLRSKICKDIVVVLKSELDKEQRNGVQY